MKQYFKVLFAVVLLVLATPNALSEEVTSEAQVLSVGSQYQRGDFLFTVRSDDTIRIDQFIGEEGSLHSIPSEICGKIVKEIGKDAFREQYTFMPITIPDTVEIIDDYAFFGMRTTNELGLPKSLVTIGKQAFSWTMITGEIPENVRDIGTFAFAGCYSMRHLYIPASVQKIGVGAFALCYSLQEISVDERNTNYTAIDNVLIDVNANKICCFPAGSGVAEYIVPEGMGIQTYAFAGTNKSILRSVSLPTTLTKLESGAFREAGISQLNITNSIETVGNAAFQGAQIDKLFIGGSVKTIGNDVFREADIGDLHIGYPIKTIGTAAFRESQIDELKIEDSVRSIGIAAFQDAKINSLSIPERIEKMDELYLYYGFERKSVLGESLGTCGDYDYKLNYDSSTAAIIGYHGNADVVFIPDLLDGYPVKVLMNNAFEHPENVVFSKEDIHIEDEAFKNLKDVKVYVYERSSAAEWASKHEMEVWNLLESTDYLYATSKNKLGVDVIRYTGNDSNISINGRFRQSINAILPGAFQNCKTIIFPDDNIKIFEGAFNNPSEITAFVYPGTSAKQWAQEHGVRIELIRDSRYTADGMTWEYREDGLHYFGTTQGTGPSLTIPGSFDGILVSVVEAVTLSENTQKVVLSEGIMMIQDYAFEDASSLQEVQFPKTIQRIGNYAFKGCESIKELDLPESLQYIGSGAFSGCENVWMLHIPANLLMIDEGAFADMKSLERFVVDTDNKLFESVDGVLYKKDSLGRQLYQYPCAKSDADFAIPEDTVAICEKAIAGVQALRSLDIPPSVKIIQDDGIQDLPNLDTVVLREGLEAIGKSVLNNCPKVLNLTIPGSVKTVADYALSNMDSLKVCVFEEGIKKIGARVLQANSSLCLVYLPNSLESICNGVDVNSNDTFTHGEIADISGFGKNMVFFVVKEGSYAEQWALKDEYIYHTLLYQIPPKEYNEAAVFLNERGNIVVCSILQDAFTFYESYVEGEVWLKTLSANASTSLSIPASINGYTVTGIDQNAFELCDQLTHITLPNSIKTIERYAFKNAPLSELTIPTSVQRLGEGAFYGIDVKKVIIPSSIQDISDKAFAMTTSLEEIVIEDGVKSIGSEAFFRATPEKVTIPASVEKIASDAFGHFQDIVIYVNHGSYAENTLKNYGFKIEYMDSDENKTNISADAQLDQNQPIIFPNDSAEHAVRYELQAEGISVSSADMIYPSEVAALEQLDLSMLNIYSIEFLKSFVGLKRLSLGVTRPEWGNRAVEHISNNMYEDLSPLAGLTDLEELDISFCHAQDISPLEGLTALKNLNLRGLYASNYESLGKLTNLENLTLWESNINDVTPLASLKNLKHLNLEGTNIQSIAALTELKNLEYLNLIDCQSIIDEETMINMTSLTTVWMETNNNELRKIMEGKLRP